MIHIARDGAQLGTFSEEETREGLAAGRFLSGDLGWKSGMAGWQPLSTFPELGAPSSIPAAQAPTRPGLPWEQRKELGAFPAYLQTLRLVLLSPGEAFSRMRLENGLGGALTYQAIGTFLNALAGWLMLLVCPRMFFLMERPMLVFMGRIMHKNLPMQPIPHGFGTVVQNVVIGPIISVLMTLVIAAVFHLCLMLLGGTKKTMEATACAVLFSLGSTMWLGILPFAGPLLAMLWGLVCVTIALAKTHDTSAGRSLAAIALPILLCCVGPLAISLFFLSQFQNMR